MNYHNITIGDMLNGDGLRVVLWVSGCSHKCVGCQNAQTWPADSGIPFGENELQEIFEALSHDYIAGFTLSGGDPLFHQNIPTVTEIVNTIKHRFPEKTIWMYTGSRFEDVQNLPVVQQVDVLVDGEYVAALRDVNAPWVGSSNQRVIDVQKSLSVGQVVLLKV